MWFQRGLSGSGTLRINVLWGRGRGREGRGGEGRGGEGRGGEGRGGEGRGGEGRGGEGRGGVLMMHSLSPGSLITGGALAICTGLAGGSSWMNAIEGVCV